MSALPFPSDAGADRRIDREAEAWIGRREAGLSSAERQALERWRAADPRHARALARLEATSAALDDLRALRPAAGPIDPDLPLGSASGRRGRRPWLPRAASIAAAALLIAWAVAEWRPFSGEVRQEARTEVGVSRTLPLPDGSVLKLNTDSAVRVTFGARERRLELTRGEAHFSVAKDAARPFIVRVGAVNVRAVGTAFTVRLHEEAVEVVVTEGHVGVQDARRDSSLLPAGPAASPPVLAAGHRATIPANARAETVLAPATVAALSPEELARRLAWQEQRLEFPPTPLREVVAEFNRYSSRRLVLADAAAAELSIGGSFRAGDAETLVRLLETHFGVEVERRGQEIRLRKRPAPPAP